MSTSTVEPAYVFNLGAIKPMLVPNIPEGQLEPLERLKHLKTTSNY
jgi:hypothetical protein